MYLKAILGYLSWPLLIIFSYLLVRWALNKFERRVALEEQAASQPATEKSPGEPVQEQSASQPAQESGD